MINPKASNRLILVTVGYFTKCVEAASLVNLINYASGLLHQKQHHLLVWIASAIITDNGNNLNNDMMDTLERQFEIRF